MRRLACVVFLLVLAAPAGAKEGMVRAEVCGADRCVRLAAGDDLWPQATAQPPADPRGYVRLKYVMRQREGTHALAVVGGVVRNDNGGWMALTPSGAARVRRAARKVEALPVAELGLRAATSGGGAPGPACGERERRAVTALRARRGGGPAGGGGRHPAEAHRGIVGPVDGDGDLVRRARSGDREAYGMLVRRHQQVAFRVAFAICGDDAEDAVQEAFIKAHGALWRFRPGAPWRPWLLRIVANEARNRRRSAGRREHLVVMAAGVAAGPAAPDYTAGELTTAIDRLEPPHREVVLLRHVLELSEAETAAVLGCRPGTVKSRLSRALDRLREELG